ncbi:hypothetical protein [Limnoglobus roseus]|uniref:Uncharacterized protein n=1 Tax=Limnoglobus roseus TaxID=2598579 RepID=A0A5C1AIA3_9BACT|nr:hypothetical protein [Limnoglobus roseus]QEL18570.1 hypothetical protein PX52LOC_05602 [Limnoglobus roseus]
MDLPFPFALPLPTAFYLTAYVVTLTAHVVFMNYVLAGTALLAVAFARPRPRPGESIAILKDWMPLMLSGAITAGIAPLLFVQILYKRGYYTANLLLFNRWMAILPALIVGFYALYLLKSQWLTRRPAWVRAAVAGVPVACVAFTGYTWTENHLLSVRSPSFWGDFYATGSQVYTEPQLVPRLLVWAFGAVPTLAVVLAWQHWYRGTGRPRSIAGLAGVGLGLVSAAAGGYALAADATTREAFRSPMAWPYFAAAVAGLATQAGGWWWVRTADQFHARRLLACSVGLALTIGGMTVCREAVRIHTLGAARFEALYPAHADAFGKGGLVLFLAFFTVNAGLIGFVFWLVRHRTVAPPPAAHGPH